MKKLFVSVLTSIVFLSFPISSFAVSLSGSTLYNNDSNTVTMTCSNESNVIATYTNLGVLIGTLTGESGCSITEPTGAVAPYDHANFTYYGLPLGVISFCEFNGTDDYSTLANCQASGSYVNTVTLNITTPSNPYINSTVQTKAQSMVSGFSSSAVSGLGSLIPIGAVLLLSVAVVYFVIKHFRSLTHN